MGWNLPDGCGRLPGEEPDPPCFSCGRMDECICPECENCGAHGCTEHMPLEEICYRLRGMERELARRGFADVASAWASMDDSEGLYQDWLEQQKENNNGTPSNS
jgi:hypothetical protein